MAGGLVVPDPLSLLSCRVTLKRVVPLALQMKICMKTRKCSVGHLDENNFLVVSAWPV